MSRFPNELRVDPWVASSALQKAIRRGEVELAQRAAVILHKHRGPGVWRRLMTVAIEDVGIADVALIGEVSRLATDKNLRAILGSESDLLNELCIKLAIAPKDRSADYLYSVSTPALRDGSKNVEPLIREAAAALALCTSAAKPMQLKEDAVRRLIASQKTRLPEVLEEIVTRFARTGGHPFVLMLLPLWTAFSAAGECTISTDELPETAFINGTPSYVFDKHTAAGKQAISRFARENPMVSRALSVWVPQANRTDVALTAAFYADAVPVARRLEWPLSKSLFAAGLGADMAEAGCPQEGIVPIFECVRRRLNHLNELRRVVLLSRAAQK